MISEKDVKKLGELARINLSPEELQKMPGEISAILEYVGQIENAISRSEVARDDALINVLRADTLPHKKGIYTTEILNEAPEKQGEYLRVKKIL